MRGRRSFLFLCLLLAPALSACAPNFHPPGPVAVPAAIEGGAFVMPDGARLPFRQWGGDGRPRAVIVALHGFNDHSRAFDAAGQWWAAHGIRTYAYDQRGFGKAVHPGLWPTSEALARDLVTVLGLLAGRHPSAPLFVLGESMGGAVAMAALAGDGGGGLADGVILAAPAVWGWSSMNVFYRIALWTGAHIFPGMTVTGDGLDVMPSDNVVMLRRMFEDPLVIKDTRIDAVYGLVNLMETASDRAADIRLPVLLLYGARDDIVPGHAVERVAERMPDADTVLYEDGYHMLLRDCQAPRVWADIAAWIARGPVPASPHRETRCDGDAGAG